MLIEEAEDVWGNPYEIITKEFKKQQKPMHLETNREIVKGLFPRVLYRF